MSIEIFFTSDYGYSGVHGNGTGMPIGLGSTNGGGYLSSLSHFYFFRGM